MADRHRETDTARQTQGNYVFRQTYTGTLGKRVRVSVNAHLAVLKSVESVQNFQIFGVIAVSRAFSFKSVHFKIIIPFM